jgi:replicative DNA helicase
MINTAEFEKIFFRFALENPSFLTQVDEGFFNNSEIDLLTKLSKAIFSKYKRTPSKDKLWAIISTKELEDRCDKNFLDEVFKHDLDSYDLDWVEDTAKSWIMFKNLDASVIDIVEYINQTKVTPENVTEIVDTVKDMINNRNSITFDDDLGADFFDPLSHKVSEEDTIKINHTWMQKELGGYAKGTLNVYVAPPNTGKSLFMGCDAADYMKAGYDVLYVSLEMNTQKINKRVGANLFNIKMNEYDKKSADPDYMQKRISTFKNQQLTKLGSLTVKKYPTSSATVDDLDNFIGKVQDATNKIFDVVIIDYINIMKDKRNPNTENTYVKIKNLCEDLRALSERRNFVCITATQTGRAGFDSSDLKLNDIAESAGLAATADNIVAIIQTPEMNLENFYWLKLLKVRDGGGKNKKCKYDVNYNYMQLFETDEVIFDELI